jgi:hypothetical protein
VFATYNYSKIIKKKFNGKWIQIRTKNLLFGRFRTHVSILVVISVLCFWQNLTNFFSSAFDIGANVVKTKSNIIMTNLVKIQQIHENILHDKTEN